MVIAKMVLVAGLGAVLGFWSLSLGNGELAVTLTLLGMAGAICVQLYAYKHFRCPKCRSAIARSNKESSWSGEYQFHCKRCKILWVLEDEGC